MAAEPPVERVGLAHAAAMAAIHAASFPLEERWGAASIAETLAGPGVLGLVVATGGMAIARVCPPESELLTLAVWPAARRRGLARRLLSAAMRIAADAGATAMFLEVAESNEAALALYREAEFATVGRRREYYASGTTALVLRAPLRPDV